MFIYNGWYATAWSEDVTRDPIERIITGVPIALYRKLDGTAVALEGTCPHRGYPMAMGRVHDDALMCGYHGLTFDCAGRCVKTPGDQRAPNEMRLRPFPLLERGGLIWSWPGDPAKADPVLCAEHWLADPALKAVHDTKIVNCRAAVAIDNLMDLSHESYLHSTSIGDEHVAATPTVNLIFADHISAKRTMLNIDPIPFAQAAGVKGKVDRTQDAQFWVPGLCITLAEVKPHSADEQHCMWTLIHCITPETPTRIRYMWAATRNYALDDQSVDAVISQAINRILDQDAVALEAQEARLQLVPDQIELSLNSDAAALAARKLIRERLRLEQQPVLV